MFVIEKFQTIEQNPYFVHKMLKLNCVMNQESSETG